MRVEIPFSCFPISCVINKLLLTQLLITDDISLRQNYNKAFWRMSYDSMGIRWIGCQGENPTLETKLKILPFLLNMVPDNGLSALAYCFWLDLIYLLVFCRKFLHLILTSKWIHSSLEGTKWFIGAKRGIRFQKLILYVLKWLFYNFVAIERKKFLNGLQKAVIMVVNSLMALW